MGVFLAWFVAIGFQTVRDVRVYNRAPIPSEFVASGAVFGSLSLLSQAQPGLAGALAWGFLISLAIQAGGPDLLAGGKAKAGAQPPTGGGVLGNVWGQIPRANLPLGGPGGRRVK